MELTKEQISDFFEKFTRMVSSMQTVAIGVRKYTPHYYLIVGPDTGTIPINVKSFHIINLGLGGNNIKHEDISVVGIVGTDIISKHIPIFGYKTESDQNILSSPIEVSPIAGHHVILQYLK